MLFNSSSPKPSNFGKYIDRFPHIQSLGKVTFLSKDSVNNCLNFQNTSPNQKRVLYNQVNSQLERCDTIHGKPDASDVYQQSYKENLELISESKRTKPLGQCRNPTKSFPDGYDRQDARFGITNQFNENAKDLIYPNQSSCQLHKEERFNSSNYLKSLKKFYPDEQGKDNSQFRKINSGGLLTKTRMRCNKDLANQKIKSLVAENRDDYKAIIPPQIPTTCSNQGVLTKSRMKWDKGLADQKLKVLIAENRGDFESIFPPQIPSTCSNEGVLTKFRIRWNKDLANQKIKILVDENCDDYKAKFPPQIDLPLKPIKDTKKLGSGNVHGSRPKLNSYKVENLKRAVLELLEYRVKALHFKHYKDLKDACQSFDRENTGLLSEEQIRSLCKQFDLHIGQQLLEQIFQICRERGKVNWKLFIETFNLEDRIYFDNIYSGYSCSNDPCKSNEVDWNIQNRLQEQENENWTINDSKYYEGEFIKEGNKLTSGAFTDRTDLPITQCSDNVITSMTTNF